MKANRLGTVAGIGIYVHWTFWVLIVGLLFAHLVQGVSLPVALAGVTVVLLLFGCVILHELGHALMARRFGIPTVDITMFPIGGVARLTRMPKEPRQEFLIAIAGPIVNLAIALALFLLLSMNDRLIGLREAFLSGTNILGQLMWMNVLLALFNMIPAFPMDGGRVLRSVLSSRMGHKRATLIASYVGQAFALLFVLAGIFSLNPILAFVGLFVFAGARQEAAMVE